jgi:hypothetical protein
VPKADSDHRRRERCAALIFTLAATEAHSSIVPQSKAPGSGRALVTGFEPKQSREEIKDAIKLEEARRAAMVKNLYRLRSLRLSRNEASTQSKK